MVTPVFTSRASQACCHPKHNRQHSWIFLSQWRLDLTLESGGEESENDGFSLSATALEMRSNSTQIRTGLHPHSTPHGLVHLWSHCLERRSLPPDPPHPGLFAPNIKQIFYFLLKFVHLWHFQIRFISFPHPDSKVHGTNMGPTWGRQDPGGPHVGHVNLAIWAAWLMIHKYCQSDIIFLIFEVLHNFARFRRPYWMMSP